MEDVQCVLVMVNSTWLVVRNFEVEKGWSFKGIREEWYWEDSFILKMTQDDLHSTIGGFLEGSKVLGKVLRNQLSNS